MAFPTKDVELIPYSENWDSRLAGDPLPFGLTAAQATQYHTLHNAFLAAYEELSISVARTRRRALSRFMVISDVPQAEAAGNA